MLELSWYSGIMAFFQRYEQTCMCLSLVDTTLPFVCHVTISKHSLERYDFFCSACLLPPFFPICLLFEKYSFGGVNTGELELIQKVYEIVCRSRG